MEDKVLEALKGSIKKHEDILAGTGTDKGPENCPLCKLFWEQSCKGCPIFIKTGEKSCVETPYTDWEQHIHNNHEVDYINGDGIYCPECRRLVELEVEFLKSLLPTSA
jgi:hypothetical protein